MCQYAWGVQLCFDSIVNSTSLSSRGVQCMLCCAEARQRGVQMMRGWMRSWGAWTRGTRMSSASCRAGIWRTCRQGAEVRQSPCQWSMQSCSMCAAALLGWRSGSKDSMRGNIGDASTIPLRQKVVHTFVTVTSHHMSQGTGSPSTTSSVLKHRYTDLTAHP